MRFNDFNRLALVAVLVMTASCAKRMDELTVKNEGTSTLHDAVLTSSGGLNLRFGVVIPDTHAAYHAYGSIKYSQDEKYTLKWKDEAGKQLGGTVELPKDFSGRLLLLVSNESVSLRPMERR